MVDLKDFQEDAVSELVDIIRKQLIAIDAGAKVDPNIIFKSPTGSGKTLMMTETLRRLAEDMFLADKYFVFLWLAPVKLHSQSYQKLKKELRDDVYNLINIDNGLSNDTLASNTILFSNWEKLNSTAKSDVPEKGLKKGDWTNVAVREGEQPNLQSILRATREAGGKIVLIVDECHQAFFGEKSRRFVDEVVQPSLIVQMSATPKESPTVETKYEDVAESGLIKNRIVINNDLVAASNEEKSVIETLISEALKQRDILADEYKKLGKNINPLLLIQLPNDTETLSDLDKRYRDIIEEYLLDEGIATEYGSMAVWLAGADEKINLENITDLDNKVKVLLFKQAIALGWDCPRAQVLLMLRDIKSDSFKIQTLGRVLRMPEATHYLNDALNVAYVYTDLESIKIDAEASDPMRNLIKYKKSRINPLFNTSLVTLPDSIFLTRVDYGDLRQSFRFVLEDVLEQAFDLNPDDDEKTCYEKFDKSLEVYDDELTTPVLSNEVLKDIDTLVSIDNVSNTVDLKMDDATVENIFNLVLRENIQPFKNFARSRSVVYTGLRKVFGRGGFDDFKIQRIFACSKENQRILANLFDEAIDQYGQIHRQEMKERRDREGKTFDFIVPETDEFSDNSTEILTIRNVYAQYFRKNNAPISTEIPFENYLDHCNNVRWWYKNGDKGEKYFAVAYYEMDDKALSHRATFYPDYIVKFKDDTVGIFDTKLGFTASDKNARQKANALQNYLRAHSDLHLWGGLVKPEGKGWAIQADYLTHKAALGEEAPTNPDYSDKSWTGFSF